MTQTMEFTTAYGEELTINFTVDSEGIEILSIDGGELTDETISEANWAVYQFVTAA